MGNLFGIFFCSGLRNTKKGVSGRAFKTRAVFLTILGSARRASGGFPSSWELNFQFCSRSRKRLQNGSKNGAFWAPKSELYSFWDTIWKKSVSFWRSQMEVHFWDPLPDPMSRGGGRGCNSGAAVPSRTLPRTSRGQKEGRNPIHGKL